MIDKQHKMSPALREKLLGDVTFRVARKYLSDVALHVARKVYLDEVMMILQSTIFPRSFFQSGITLG